jgi:hypothetical protein
MGINQGIADSGDNKWANRLTCPRQSNVRLLVYKNDLTEIAENVGESIKVFLLVSVVRLGHVKLRLVAR